MHHPVRTIEVIVPAAEKRDELLSDAEFALRQAACPHGKAGILVIRHAPHAYTVSIDESVPFGQTHERCLL
ncbi:hypothetical protein AB6813_04695 [bacterium RCC_150]